MCVCVCCNHVIVICHCYCQCQCHCYCEFRGANRLDEAEAIFVRMAKERGTNHIITAMTNNILEGGGGWTLSLTERTNERNRRTVTGASTRCTLLSSTRISRALKHKALTSPSLKYSHRLRRSICSSKQEFPAAVNDDAAIFVVRLLAAAGAAAGCIAGIVVAAPASVGFLVAIIPGNF